MTGPDARGAVAALEAARPAVERLDATRHPEENAADLVEIWSAVEASLRALLGGSALSGQPLVREVRQGELISLEQAHAALELLAVRERVERGAYQPVPSDLDAAREAYGALTRAFGTPGAPTAAANPAASPLGDRVPEVPGAPPALAAAAASPSPPPPNRTLGIGLVVLGLVLVGGGYYWFRGARAPSMLDAGIAAYAAGQRDSARADFDRAVRDDPRASAPHVYLARLAREDGDFSTAGRELKTAVQLEPASAPAQSELGAFFLARGSRFTSHQRPDLASEDYDAARRAYVRAVQLAPADTAAQGYLACALTRLGRTTEAASWFARAGAGPWSACAATPSNARTTSPAP